MTLGRDILYAALTGLMHGGLTVYPARWAGLRHAAPLALWGGRETHNRLFRLSGWVEAYRAIGALEQAQRASPSKVLIFCSNFAPP